MMGRCSKGYNKVVTRVKALLTLAPGVGEGFTVCEFNFEMQIRIYQVEQTVVHHVDAVCTDTYVEVRTSM